MIDKTSTNYTFRTVDLSLFPDLVVPNVPVEVKIGIGAKSVTGHSKAAQNFLKALMTPLGHFKSDPEYGSEFAVFLNSGRTIYAEDLPNLFATESLRVVEYLFTSRGDDVPDDEVIDRAVLGSYSVEATDVNLTILLYYRNEDTPKEFVIPFNLNSK
jgi:hypothetical protein